MLKITVKSSFVFPLKKGLWYLNFFQMFFRQKILIFEVYWAIKCGYNV